jgi:3',5'-cyclic AMP phosphodiesterase CpdA
MQAGGNDNTKMKIFHISDLHLDIKYKRSNYIKTRSLFEQITAEGFDHLIISGDISENADASSLGLGRNLLEKFGLLDRSKTTLIIGNHDIFGGVYFAEDVINFPSKCIATDYHRKVEQFEYYFRETFQNIIAAKKNTFFPFVKEFDDFVLIGLNSIAKYSLMRNPMASNGTISKEQISSAAKIIKHSSFNNKRRIVISHHHFSKHKIHAVRNTYALWRMIESQSIKLRKKKSIIKQLKALDVEMVLHGHKHCTQQYERKGIRFINAGSSVLGHRANEINIVEINVTPGGITSKFRKFHTDNIISSSKKRRLPVQFNKRIHDPEEISLN